MRISARRLRAVGSRRGSLAKSLLVSTAVALAVASPAAANLVPSKSKTVLFVHGYNPTSNSTDCGGDFDNMISQMRSEGFTGSMVKVGYYSQDVNCNVNLHSYGNYGDSDSWKRIAAAFSNYVYQTYTSQGVTVDVVGYSMGGLVARGAVFGALSGASGFSSPINVSDSVTLGTPHSGAAWYSNGCASGTQCSTLAPGSTDLNWLNQNGNPQGTQGTTWTTYGSYQDDVVPWDSAIYMSILINRKLVFSNISHTGAFHPNYMHSWDVVNSVDNMLGSVPGKVLSGINTNKCVDVRQSATSNGTPVQIYDCNGTGAQIWAHSSNGSTLLTALGKCLDVTGASSSSGTKVELWDCNTGTNQHWAIGSDHTLQSLGKCLDVPNSNTTNGNQLQIWDCNGTAAQRWYFG
jgi:triacylglycerol esterase/lipase EstA (alpha/beta hydrolase family)